MRSVFSSNPSDYADTFEPEANASGSARRLRHEAARLAVFQNLVFDLERLVEDGEGGLFSLADLRAATEFANLLAGKTLNILGKAWRSIVRRKRFGAVQPDSTDR